MTSSLSSSTAAVVLEKVMYRHKRGKRGWVRVAPMGGEGVDAAATLNPLSKGMTLTSFGSRGPALLAGCRGASVCGSFDFADGLFGVSAGGFAAPDGTRALAQVTARPGTRAAMSLFFAGPLPRRHSRWGGASSNPA